MQKSSLANEDYKQLEENALELSKVSEKLNNSEYHSQFTEAITKQAERLVEEGENLSLDEFINKKLFIINQNKAGILSILIQAWYKVEYLFTVHEQMCIRDRTWADPFVPILPVLSTNCHRFVHA